jgi:hypothetical protein
MVLELASDSGAFLGRKNDDLGRRMERRAVVAALPKQQCVAAFWPLLTAERNSAVCCHG